MQHQIIVPQQLGAPSAATRGCASPKHRARRAHAPRRLYCVGQSAGATGTHTAVSLIDEREVLQANRRPSTPQLQLVSRVCYLPHPAKESYGGEDAHFISEATGALGVADGVGGWAESGINPAEYSRTLMAVAHAHLEGRDLLSVIPERTQTSLAVREFIRNPVPPPLPGVVDPQAAVDVAHRLTRLPGSSTVCLLQLDPYSESLIAANVGDSGFMLVRNGQKALQSRPLEHFFDCPLQLGAFPEFVQATDSAADAELYEIPLQHGDVVIVGTDGLWDNCYDKELLSLVPRSPDEVQASADAMAALARRHASDPDFASPYIQEARQNGFDLPWWEKLLGAKLEGGQIKLKDPTGGKQDDITVIVAFVEYLEDPLEGPLAANGAHAVSSNGSGVSVVVVEELEAAVNGGGEAAAEVQTGANGAAVEAAASAAAAVVEEPQQQQQQEEQEEQEEQAAVAAAAVSVQEAEVTVEEPAVTVEEPVLEVAAAAGELPGAGDGVAGKGASSAVAVVEAEAAGAVLGPVVDEAAAAQVAEVGAGAAGGAAAALVAQVKVAVAVAAAAAAVAAAEELVGEVADA